MASLVSSLDTQVPVAKTVGDIHSLLCQAGAEYISTRYDKDRLPDAISFSILVPVPGGPLRLPMHFVLPARWQGTRKFLSGRRRGSGWVDEQARRVAWRNVYFWLKAQLATVELEQAEVIEVFLPYAVGKDGETTLFQALKKQQFAGLLPERTG